MTEQAPPPILALFYNFIRDNLCSSSIFKCEKDIWTDYVASHVSCHFRYSFLIIKLTCWTTLKQSSICEQEMHFNSRSPCLGGTLDAIRLAVAIILFRVGLSFISESGFCDLYSSNRLIQDCLTSSDEMLTHFSVCWSMHELSPPESFLWPTYIWECNTRDVLSC